MQKDNTSHAYRYFQLEQQILTLNGKQELQEAFAFDVLRKVTIPKGSFKTMWSIAVSYTHLGRLLEYPGRFTHP